MANKWKYITGLVAWMSLLVAGTQIAEARNYYVATYGNDANSGTDINNAFKTIQKGVSSVMSPGDVVYVLPGSYKQQDAYQYGNMADIRNKHGEPGNEIFIKAYDMTNRPRLEATSGIRVIASSYVVIEGFEITNTSKAGIPIYISNHITVKNNYIHLGYEGYCSQSEPAPYTGCTYYPGLGMGEAKGRYDHLGNIIVEHDGSQNTGVYLCKSSNNTIVNNYLVNLDESIYVGSAGDVKTGNCWSPEYNINPLWTENNIIDGNIIENSWNEAIELKPDTRFNKVSNNVVRSTHPHVEAVQIEIRGHNNEIFGNVVVGAPNIAIRSMSETVADPATDRREEYKKPDGSYKSAYENYIHDNWVYYWSDHVLNGLGINSHDKSAADRIEHNTLVGFNRFTGKVSEYASIKANGAPGLVVRDNLMIGPRRYDTQVGNEKYEWHLTSYNSYLPVISDYNAYYPKTKTNNQSCVVSLGTLGIICQDSNNYNQTVNFEYHSKFLESNPLRSEEYLCNKTQLLDIPIQDLAQRVKWCSTLNTRLIGSDGKNIGANFAKSGDANNDGSVDGLDYVIWVNHYGQNISGGAGIGDFNMDGNVDGIDYVVWLGGYGN